MKTQQQILEKLDAIETAIRELYQSEIKESEIESGDKIYLYGALSTTAASLYAAKVYLEQAQDNG